MEISTGENKIKIVLQFRVDFSVVFRRVNYSHIDSRQVHNSADCNDSFFLKAYQVGRRISQSALLHVIIYHKL